IGRRNTAVEAKTDSKRITADSTVREVVSRYPTTGPIFLQHGRMFRARAGELYASYDPPLTIREYAAVNRIDVESLVSLLASASRFGSSRSLLSPTWCHERPSPSACS